MELLDKFMDYLLMERNYSPHTITAYKKDIQDFFNFSKETSGVVSEAEIAYTHVRMWVVSLNQDEISNRSINRKITALKSFYAFLQKIEAVKENPIAKQKNLKTQKKVIIPFSEKEIGEVFLIENDDLCDFDKVRNRALIHLFYATGIRQAELMDLKIFDVDLKQQTIKVLGKRNKERIVPVYEEVVEDLKRYLEDRGSIGTNLDYFFVTKKGGKMYGALVYRIINSYFSKVSTKQKKSPHVLRHSYATDLVNNGADLNSVKELLGHSSLAATQVYTHNSLEKLKKVYNQAHPRSAQKKKNI
ncbi:tyrosine-type recombinase/integrase [Wenyingzhuangia sp. 2_MG-2023]|uniref:tyrosine-type recombinase/integrase n=1 Tax=Wenyingzhuangia sp. 2_MG-2023 TaxID=3062639 RepID=UPI0026E42706|nr:tyrosine-type recombinase/integrase [Wenyingzhuangia sp. 2_MG-2023]MDO6737248.1 tyrosine-type recombinase/integrase [Wenyingzhuangia sp. 2_MG-2023]